MRHTVLSRRVASHQSANSAASSDGGHAAGAHVARDAAASGQQGEPEGDIGVGRLQVVRVSCANARLGKSHAILKY